MPRATRAAAALKETLGIEAALTKGERGTFEVQVDGNTVVGRSFFGFPSEEKIVEAVGKAIGRAPAA